MSNCNLNKAKKTKNDEFYTLYEDIEEELQYYGDCFRNKIVYCNCDNPYESNFVKYFYDNFARLGLKELRATCWSGEPTRRKLSLFPEETTKFQEPYRLQMTHADVPLDSCITYLRGNGDFRSRECRDLLETSDIVATNPPFSLFGDFIELLFDFNKDFVLICNKNALGTESIVQRIAKGYCRVGHTSMSKDLLFRIPEEHADYLVSQGRVDSYRVKNQILGRAPAVWFTSLKFDGFHKKPKLTTDYSADRYPHYDNLDVIEVSHVADIPRDYQGVMGVPITFLNIYDSDMFNMLSWGDLGLDSTLEDKASLVMSHLTIDGSACYKRLFIRNKNPYEGEGTLEKH